MLRETEGSGLAFASHQNIAVEEHASPNFIANFSSASQEHYHFEKEDG